MATPAQAVQVGGKTAQELTKEVMAAVEDQAVIITASTFSKLDTVTRYLNRERISAKGEGWFKRNYDNLVADTVEVLITGREKQILSYLDKKELQDKDESFRELLARGTEIAVAYKQCYGEEAFKAYTIKQAELAQAKK